MICKNCGKEIDDNSIFCTECGAKVSSPIPEQPVAEIKPETEAVAESGAVAVPAEPAPVEPVAAAPAPIPVSFQAQNTAPIPPEPQRTANRFDAYQPYAQQSNPGYRQPAPAYTQPLPYPPKPAVPETAENAVSTGIYMLMLIVGAIPLVGLLIHIIALAATKNKGFKNYCRAYVILGIIVLALTIIAFIVGYFMFDKIQAFFRQFNIDIQKSF